MTQTDITRRVAMTNLRLRKASFLIMQSEFSRVGDKGKAIYRPAIAMVYGEVFNCLGYKWGIYKREHVGNKRRKCDYVMIDLSTGLPVRIDSRKINVLNALELSCLQYELKQYMTTGKHASNEAIFRKLKGETHAKR